MDEAIVKLRNAQIYQQDFLVLQDVNLTIGAGDFIYLIGKTGSGKSSLLKILYGDLPLNHGEGEVLGFDMRKFGRKDIPPLRRQLGIIFQDFNLLMDRSVDDNLKFVLRATGWKDTGKIEDRIKSVLDKVGLKDKGFKMPHEISGGEQQRVVIARSLLNNPTLILADEPTGNLDPDTSDEILKVFHSLAKENATTIIFATHDYNIIDKYPARIIRCQGGKIIDDW